MTAKSVGFFHYSFLLRRGPSSYALPWELLDSGKINFSLLPGSPITNKVCIASQHGEIYGLDHDIQRFQPLTVAQLR
jgi:hypothetical protein